MTAAGARPDPGFVGRVDEVARLTEAVRSALDGSPSLCLVIGEAGIGKSRLAARVAAEARELGLDVAWTEAEEGAGPFSALAGLRARAETATGADDARWDQLEAAAGVIEARAPVLVIIEDFHWADESSAWVVERLGRQLQGVPACVVLTARSEEPGQERLGRLLSSADRVVRLAGMSRDETIRLAELAAPGSEVDGAGLWERTGGVPLFVREAAVLAAEGGGTSRATEVLRRRFERLGAENARVLAAVALAPGGTSLLVLARALNRPVEVVAGAVDIGRAEELVVDERGGGIRFRHALLAEAAAENVPPAAQRELRLALAAALEAEGSGPARARAAELRLLALPAGDAAAAAVAALEAVVALRAADDGSAASALAGTAIGVLATYGAPPDVLAALHVERGESLFELGEKVGAGHSFAAAAELAPADPALRARAETGRAWYVNPLVPDTGTIDRLTATAAALDPADTAVRVRLLGRLAAASIAHPAARERGRRTGEEAVAMARRIGDPALLSQALADLHLAPVTPAEWAAREAAADELVALGERLGRPDVALLGYEWQFGERLGRADRPGAEEALGRLELYAHLSSSPRWRLAAGLRRATLVSLAGDRDRCLDVLASEFESAGPWIHPQELVGIGMTFRAATAFVYGVPDPALAERFSATEEAGELLAAPFVRASLALGALALGEDELARTHLGLAIAGLDILATGLESLFALNACGLVAGMLAELPAARAVRPLLEPFADRLSSGSASVLLPTATTIGLLADLQGDHGAAVRYHRQGIALADRVQSAVLAARCRELADHVTASAAEPHRATLTRSDVGWQFTTPFGTGVVEESRGLVQLVEVLRANGKEVSALDLAGADSGGSITVQSDLGPALDSQAKRAYRSRIADLREEIDEADAMNDPDRASRARWELDALLEELSRAVGLSGRDRPQGATDERARVNVTRSIKRAIAAVGASAPELGAHLEVSVRTGRQCRYQPDPAVAVTWEVTTS
ncbi:ATP-binding protein [Nocardioides sp. HM23]|uniref:ATP-binding protein n=1 Tax=Nocardioides bizhenqiangii TaxID=3095076 RepID=UPI002ACACD70|nr:ATP-binding protein [Nocardioides sp. HM23]MDZ5620881.1 ATP-binding protein [Nocardioides sp. HM23]